MHIGLTFNLKSDARVTDNDPEDRFEEFDSEETIAALEQVIRGRGHRVTRLGWGTAMLDGMAEAKRNGQPIEGVFNLAEGIGGRGREAQVPAVLEMLRIPHTGSDALTLGLTLDKALAKRVAASHGIPIAPFVTVSKIEDLEQAHALRLPLFAKPAAEGSSMGIRDRSVVEGWEDLHSLTMSLLQDYPGSVLIEEFLSGDEFTVGVIGNGAEAHVVGTMQVVPKGPGDRPFVYSLDVKREFRQRVDYIMSGQLDPVRRAAVEQVALDVHRVFGCRDVSRVDIRFDRDDRPAFIEVNPLPGMNPSTSDLIILASGHGWTYDELIGSVLAAAIRRWAGQ
ncbi:MAG TPA: D-alanine--D-alanine ligase [Thermoanaerobaculia bacterium]|nr:D-alanine--D-alanine ligase [Thermoanaerobaculia bacterium]